MNKYYDKDEEVTLTLYELALISIHASRLLVPINLINQYVRDEYPDQDWIVNFEEIDTYWIDTLRCITDEEYKTLIKSVNDTIKGTAESVIDPSKTYRLSITTLFPRAEMVDEVWTETPRGVMYSVDSDFIIEHDLDEDSSKLVLKPVDMTQDTARIVVTKSSFNLTFKKV